MMSGGHIAMIVLLTIITIHIYLRACFFSEIIVWNLSYPFDSPAFIYFAYFVISQLTPRKGRPLTAFRYLRGYHSK